MRIEVTAAAGTFTSGGSCASELVGEGVLGGVG